MYFTRCTSTLQISQTSYNTHMCPFYTYSRGYKTYSIHTHFTCHITRFTLPYHTYKHTATLTCILQNLHSIYNTHMHSTKFSHTSHKFTRIASQPPPHHLWLFITPQYMHIYLSSKSPTVPGAIHLIFMWSNQLFLLPL